MQIKNKFCVNLTDPLKTGGSVGTNPIDFLKSSSESDFVSQSSIFISPLCTCKLLRRYEY